MARELIDEIITLIHSESNNNPPPKPCKIIKNYNDEPYCDIEVEDLGVLIHKKTIGSTKIGSEGIICFLNGDLKQAVVITSQSYDISELDIDMSNLEFDFDLKFGLSGREDIITVDTILKLK